MVCNKCGAQAKEGDEICCKCGAPLVRNAYIRQISESDTYQKQYRHTQVPKSNKVKILLFSAAAVLIAATAVLFIYPGILTVKQTVAVSKEPLSADTIQTKFIAENVNVIMYAFDGFGNNTMERVMTEPFEMTLDITGTFGGQSLSSKTSIAYDNKTLGIETLTGNKSAKAALIGNILYIQDISAAYGLRFDSSNDTSQSKTLQDRLSELMGRINTAADSEKYGSIFELCVNSIDEKCFKISESKEILKLNTEDIINALNKISDALSKDKKLKEAFDESLNKVGITKDSLVYIDELISNYEKSESKEEAVWEVSYINGRPVSMAIKIGEQYEITFGYEDTSSGKDISFAVKIGTKINFSGNINFNKTADGIDYNGNILNSGTVLIFAGSEKWNGNTTKGVFEVTIDGQAFKYQYDEILNFVVPFIAVADDGRFKIDTEKADISNVSDIYNLRPLQ